MAMRGKSLENSVEKQIIYKQLSLTFDLMSSLFIDVAE